MEKFESLRLSQCPDKCCGLPLVFDASSKLVRCRMCNGMKIDVSQLQEVITAKSIEVGLEWISMKAALMEKSGGIYIGRARLVNRLIDGVSNYLQILVLYVFFEEYGVTDTGDVKTLSEMGRTEPINPVTISDYAFGIRMEHLHVMGYGMDRKAVRYLWDVMDAIGRVNVRPKDVAALVPLSAEEDTQWALHTACLLSIACTGRAIFGRRLAVEAMKHLAKFAAEYQKRSSYDQAVWTQIANAEEPAFRIDGKQSCLLDVAALANVLCRSIVLLTADSSYAAQVFVPFLHHPDDCRDRTGKLRSPLVLAWKGGQHSSLVAMVSIASAREISPVWIPRDWFKSVWGFSGNEVEQLISMYLELDHENRCLVANGKYFKPEYLRRYVMAFDKAALYKHGFVTYMLSDFMEAANLMAVKTDGGIVQAAADGHLWRCLQCGYLSISANPAWCTECFSGEYFRQQCVDGSIAYQNGDHTNTPAPNSWCFTKRKHFWNGAEYDNAPQRFEIQFMIEQRPICESVMWFSGESDQCLNSNVQQLACDIARKHTSPSIDAMALNVTLTTLITEHTGPSGQLRHRTAHLKETLGDTALEKVLDGCEGDSQLRSGAEDMDTLLIEAQETYEKYFTFRDALLFMLSQGGSQDALIANGQSQKLEDERTFRELEKILSGCDQEERWRRLFSRPWLFTVGGFYYAHVSRLAYRIPRHFKLPLMGNAKFTLSDTAFGIVLCLFGEHMPVDIASLDALRILKDQLSEEGCDDCGYKWPNMH